jgi:rubrerythrin
VSRYIDADKGLRSRIQIETGCNFVTADRIVESRPTADVKPVVHGKWEKNEHTFLTCNKCGFVNKYNRMQYAYCPNCGAEMRGEE